MDIDSLFLPVDVIPLILSYLEPKVVTTLALVSRDWNDASKYYFEQRAMRKWPGCKVELYGGNWKALYMDNNKKSMEGDFRWEVKNYSTITEQKILSDEFDLGGYPWCILMFPRGNHDKTSLAVYLKNTDKVKDYPMRHTKITFTVINHKDSANNRVRSCEHFFDRDEPDWGFTSFMKLADITREDSGFLDADDTLVVNTHVAVTPHKEDNEFDPDEDLVITRLCEFTQQPRSVVEYAFVKNKRDEQKTGNELIDNPSRYIKEVTAKKQEEEEKEEEKDTEN